MAAERIQVFYPEGTRYDVPGLKQAYFGVELLYIANLIRWGMLAEAKDSANDLLPVAYSEQDVSGIVELLEQVLDELEVRRAASQGST